MRTVSLLLSLASIDFSSLLYAVLVQATQSLPIDKGEVCVLSAKVAGTAKLGTLLANKFPSNAQGQRPLQFSLDADSTLRLRWRKGFKIIFKPSTSSIAHLLCKHAATNGVTGFFEPSDSGELILEFDNSKVRRTQINDHLDGYNSCSLFVGIRPHVVGVMRF